MTAVVLDSYSGAEALRVEQRPVPRPAKHEVLVKVEASPLNPSDLAFLEGRYGFQKEPPVVPGGEGSGTVVAAGAGLMCRYLLGKRVACLRPPDGDGVWAEYMVTTAKGGALPLHPSVSLEQGAMSAINPLTASAFLEIVKKGGHQAIVLTAAASALGQMVNRLGRSQGIRIINVVRRSAQVEFLEQRGATIVLNSNDKDFVPKLREVCQRYEARLAFDAVAGPLTGQLLEALPRHGKVTVYGGLSWEAAQAGPDQLIFQDKSLDGFWLGPWLARKNLIQILMIWRRAQRLLGSELESEIRARYPLREAQTAVREYQRQMTGGKILLRPHR